MAPGMKPFLIFLILVCSFSGNHGIQEAANLINPHFEVRKLLGGGVNVDALLDYHEGRANNAHDPGKGKPVGKGANNS